MEDRNTKALQLLTSIFALLTFLIFCIPSAGTILRSQNCEFQFKEFKKVDWKPLGRGLFTTRLTGQFRAQAQNILKADKPHPKEKIFAAKKLYKIIYQTEQKELLELIINKDELLIAYRYSIRLKKKRQWKQKCFLKKIGDL